MAFGTCGFCTGCSISFAADNNNGSITFVNKCQNDQDPIAVYSHWKIGQCPAYTHWIRVHRDTPYKLSDLNTNCNFYFSSETHWSQAPLYNNHWTSATVTYVTDPQEPDTCAVQISRQ